MKNLKPSKTAVQKATAKKPVTVFSTGGVNDGKYVGKLDKKSGAFGSFTLAALVSSQYAAVVNNQLVEPKAGVKPDPKRFDEVTGVKSYWTSSGMLADSGLTTKGWENIRSRLAGTHKSGVKADIGLVKMFVTAIAKGGDVKVGEGVVSVKAAHTL